MIDPRKAVAEQIGLLVMLNIEQGATIAVLTAENERLKATQSKGAAKAEKHLAEQKKKK